MSNTIGSGLPYEIPLFQQSGSTRPPSGGGTDSLAAFGEAMRAAGATGPQPAQRVEGVQVAQVQPAGTISDVPLPTQVQNVNATDPADSARQRAVEGLELSQEPVGATGPGQSILDGLQRLRGVFDGQFGNLNERIGEARFDAGDLMRVQAEVVTFSVMVDVSSKLAGKSTQAMDTLMKGQ